MFKPRAAMLVGVIGFTAAFTACALPMRSVTLAATPADWRLLDGDWRGEYWMQAYDRHGTIAFRLLASTEEAHGEVLMISDRLAWPYQSQPGVSPVLLEPRTQLLAIRFVRADRGQIAGQLDAYWDPDRRCRAATSFVGSLDGDVMRGTVVSHCEEDVRVLSGRWKVQRKRSGAG
jgi:hypothetical protein